MGLSCQHKDIGLAYTLLALAGGVIGTSLVTWQVTCPVPCCFLLVTSGNTGPALGIHAGALTFKQLHRVTSGLALPVLDDNGKQRIL
jgi:hypothetical protein